MFRVPALPRSSVPGISLIAVFAVAGLLRLRGCELAAFLLIPVVGAAAEWAYRKRRGRVRTVDRMSWTAAACITGCALFSGIIGGGDRSDFARSHWRCVFTLSGRRYTLRRPGAEATPHDDRPPLVPTYRRRRYTRSLRHRF